MKKLVLALLMCGLISFSLVSCLSTEDAYDLGYAIGSSL
jgi:hypothetical protein